MKKITKLMTTGILLLIGALVSFGAGTDTETIAQKLEKQLNASSITKEQKKKIENTALKVSNNLRKNQQKEKEFVDTFNQAITNYAELNIFLEWLKTNEKSIDQKKLDWVIWRVKDLNGNLSNNMAKDIYDELFKPLEKKAESAK